MLFVNFVLKTRSLDEPIYVGPCPSLYTTLGFRLVVMKHTMHYNNLFAVHQFGVLSVIAYLVRKFGVQNMDK